MESGEIAANHGYLESCLASAICDALRATDPSGYVGDHSDNECTIDGHFDVPAVARALLASPEFSIHLVKKVENSVSSEG